MDRNDDEWVRRMQADLRDGYDEELELEWEEHRLEHVLKSEVDAAAEAQDRVARKLYFRELFRLQGELVKLQDWVSTTRHKVVIIFEGRDAAGKGGVIKRITQRLNPRVCRVAVLPAPNDRERTQWYCESIGLTSRRHAAWVREAGMFDAVLGYDELERLAEMERCLVIDFSGDPQLQDRVVTALGRRCAALLRVGSTHGGAFAIGPAAARVPGSLFSGPEQIERRVAQWGPAEFDRRLAHALSDFTAAMQAHCTVDHRDGAEDTVAAWRAIQQGSVDPSTLLIVRPYPPCDR